MLVVIVHTILDGSDVSSYARSLRRRRKAEELKNPKDKHTHPKEHNDAVNEPQHQA